MRKTQGLREFKWAIGLSVIALFLSAPTFARGEVNTKTNVFNDIAIIPSPSAKDVRGHAAEVTSTPPPMAAELASINQPNLIAHHERVKFFRDQFAVLSEDFYENMLRDAPKDEQGSTNNLLVDRQARLSNIDAPEPLSVQQLAIESLKQKIAARQAPNPLMPLGGLATTLYLLSNGVTKIMISKLGAGHLPVYGDDGEIVGTRHAISGKLTAGRENPKKKGHIWSNQG